MTRRFTVQEFLNYHVAVWDTIELFTVAIVRPGPDKGELAELLCELLETADAAGDLDGTVLARTKEDLTDA